MSHSSSGKAEEVGMVSRAGQGVGLQLPQFRVAEALKELPLIFTSSVLLFCATSYFMEGKV